MRYLVVLLLAGCAANQPAPQYRWIAISNSAANLEQAKGECEAYALSSHPAMNTERGLRIFFGCMQGKGWRITDR